MCQIHPKRRRLYKNDELKYTVKQLCFNSLTETFESQAVCLTLKWTHRNIQTCKECRAGSAFGTVTVGVTSG